MILTSSVLLFETGCNGSNKRPYAASDAVATFKEASWKVNEKGENYQVQALWFFEKEMTHEDIVYQYREGIMITPGFWAVIQKRLIELKHLKERSEL